jgi:hypothetical protein
MALLFVNIRERRRHKPVDAPKQMILWNALIEPKLIKQTRDGDVLNPFFDSIDPQRT